MLSLLHVMVAHVRFVWLDIRVEPEIDHHPDGSGEWKEDQWKKDCQGNEDEFECYPTVISVHERKYEQDERNQCRENHTERVAAEEIPFLPIKFVGAGWAGIPDFEIVFENAFGAALRATTSERPLQKCPDTWPPGRWEIPRGFLLRCCDVH